MTTTTRSVVVAQDGSSGFFRIANEATNSVIPFTVLMSGGADVPPVNTTATGSGLLSPIGNELNYNITYSGLSAVATAAHIHGPADTNGVAMVLQPLTGRFATSGTLAGKQVLAQSQLTNVIDGMTYMNIHNTSHPNGEIRGQAVFQ